MKKSEVGLQKQIGDLREWFGIQWRNNPLGLIFVIVLGLVLALVIWVTAINKRLGFDDKLLWNWMDLLVVPVLVAFVVWILDRREHVSDRIAAKERVDHEQDITNQRAMTDRKINNDRLNQQTLESCLEYISEQLLNAHVSPISPEVKTTIVRAWVLEVIDSLAHDYKRRDQVLRFLQETSLLHETLGTSHPLFVGANLTKLRLRRADLKGADFSGAILTSADLCKANLSKAKFVDTNLEKTRLSGASLEEAILTRADLTNACLAKAKMANAHLAFAQLINANLKRAILNGTKMNNAWLNNANLEKAQLADSDLSGAVLMGANLSSAVLKRATIINADLRDTILHSTNLEIEEGRFDFVKLRGAIINAQTSMSMPTKLRQVLEIQGRTPEKSDNGEDSETERSSEEQLLGLLASESPESYVEADLSNSDLNGVNLQGFDLSDVNFSGSWLRGADLAGSILHRANLTNSDLTDADLSGAEMNDCDLSGAIYTKAQLNEANYVPPIYMV